MKKQIDVVGAVVIADGKVLCVQRGPHGALPGMWEFPGGKIKPSETAQEALQREIREELECEVVVGQQVTTTTYDYDFGIVTLTTFYCEVIDGTPHLVEHADLRWLDAHDLEDLDWAPADLPAVAIIGRHLTSESARDS